MSRPTLTDDQRTTLTHLMNALPGLSTWRPDARAEVLELLAEAAANLPDTYTERMDRVFVFAGDARAALTTPPRATVAEVVTAAAGDEG